MNNSRGMMGNMGGMGGGSSNFMGGMSQNMSMGMGNMGGMSQKISGNMGVGNKMIGGRMNMMGNEPMNMGNRMSGNFSREEISFMGGNFGDGNNLGTMSHRMQSGMNNPSFEGNSGHRAGPMRSGMDRDFRGESRRSESSSFCHWWRR